MAAVPGLMRPATRRPYRRETAISDLRNAFGISKRDAGARAAQIKELRGRGVAQARHERHMCRSPGRGLSQDVAGAGTCASRWRKAPDRLASAPCAGPPACCYPGVPRAPGAHGRPATLPRGRESRPIAREPAADARCLDLVRTTGSSASCPCRCAWRRTSSRYCGSHGLDRARTRCWDVLDRAPVRTCSSIGSSALVTRPSVVLCVEGARPPRPGGSDCLRDAPDERHRVIGCYLQGARCADRA
jgi:hypothetical protein